jgi:hypothetical protein
MIKMTEQNADQNDNLKCWLEMMIKMTEQNAEQTKWQNKMPSKQNDRTKCRANKMTEQNAEQTKW